MNSSVMTKYADFLEFRQKALEFMAKSAVYKEERDNAVVRPVTIVNSEDEINAIRHLIAEWHSKADEIIALDPLRFSEKSQAFNPRPQILNDVESFSIVKSTSTHSEKIPKEKIIKRMKKYLSGLEVHAKKTGDYKMHAQIKAELENMLSDNEEYYRLRNSGNVENGGTPDIVCNLRYTNGLSDKVRVPFAGLVIYDPAKRTLFKQPRQQRPRGDSYVFLSVSPIPCSLASASGLLYRESELEKARAKYRERKNLV